MKNLLTYLILLIVVAGCGSKLELKQIISENNCWKLSIEKRKIQLGTDTIFIDEKGNLGRWCFNDNQEFLAYNKKNNLVDFPDDVVVERTWKITNNKEIYIYNELHYVKSFSDSTIELVRNGDNAYFFLEK
jgi:hypothetical protein